MEKRLQERLNMEDGTATDQSRFVDFGDWPVEFES